MKGILCYTAEYANLGKWSWNSFCVPPTQNRYSCILEHSQWMASPFRETVTTRITNLTVKTIYWLWKLKLFWISPFNVESLMKNSVQVKLFWQLIRWILQRPIKPRQAHFRQQDQNTSTIAQYQHKKYQKNNNI